MKELYKALHNARKEFSTVKKNGTNPHFKSRYADLESVLDATEESLDKNGLLIVTILRESCLETSLIHAESGESLTSYYPINQALTDQQKGSAITYGRRYSIQSLLNLVAEDDDGNQASNARKPEPKSFDGLDIAKRSQAFIGENDEVVKLQAGLARFKGYANEFNKAKMMDVFAETVAMFEKKISGEF